MYTLESADTNDYRSLDKKVRLGLEGLNVRFHALPPPTTHHPPIHCTLWNEALHWLSNSLHVRWARRTAWRRSNKPHIVGIENYIIRLLSNGPAGWVPPVRSCPGRTGGQLQMNRLSLRNNRLKLETSRKLPIVWEESIEYTSKWMKAT